MNRKIAGLIIGFAILCLVIGLISLVRSTTPSGGPYFLQVPTSTWSYQIAQFSNGTYYMVNGLNWHVDFSSTNASAVINNAIGNVTTPSKIVLVGTITLTNTIVIDTPVSLYFDEIDLSASMTTNGIEIKNVNAVGLFGSKLIVQNAAWNASAILIENSVRCIVEVSSMGGTYGAPLGIGIEVYAANGEWTSVCTIQNTRIASFTSNVYYHTLGTGYISGIVMRDCETENCGFANLRFYDNGNGIGGNQFTNLLMEPPATGGNYYIHFSEGPARISPWQGINSFFDLSCWDVNPTDTCYYADTSVHWTQFIGGFINLGQVVDLGYDTGYAGVFDTYTQTYITSSSSSGSSGTIREINLPTNAGWFESVAGTGATSQTPTYMRVTTGVAAGGLAELYINAFALTYQGTYFGWIELGLNHPFTFSFSFTRYGDTSATDEICYVELTSTTALADLSDDGIGVKLVNDTLYGQSFGTTLESVALGTIPNDAIYNMRIVIDDTSVEFYLNGVLSGTITTATALPGWVTTPKLLVAIENGATMQEAAFMISNIKVYFKALV